MNKIQKVGFTSLAMIATVQQALAMGFWQDKVQTSIVWNQNTVDKVIQDLVGKVMWFLWLLAVLLAIYWGFMILTAAWDDGKVKKGKTILTQAALGLIVIFLAYSIVNFVIGLLFWTASN